MISVIRFIDYMVTFDFNDIKGMIFGFMKLINKVLILVFVINIKNFIFGFV